VTFVSADRSLKFLSKEVTTLRSIATPHFLISYTRKLQNGETVICEARALWTSNC